MIELGYECEEKELETDLVKIYVWDFEKNILINFVIKYSNGIFKSYMR